MAQIGTFTRDESGAYIGTIKSLTLNVRASIKPCDRDNEKAPDYRVTANGVEFGAGWSKTARETGAEYLSLKLDDRPSPLRSTHRWSRATRASTSSSGRADRPAAPRNRAGRRRSPPWDHAERADPKSNRCCRAKTQSPRLVVAAWSKKARETAWFTQVFGRPGKAGRESNALFAAARIQARMAS